MIAGRRDGLSLMSHQAPTTIMEKTTEAATRATAAGVNHVRVSSSTSNDLLSTIFAAEPAAHEKITRSSNSSKPADKCYLKPSLPRTASILRCGPLQLLSAEPLSILFWRFKATCTGLLREQQEAAASLVA